MKDRRKIILAIAVLLIVISASMMLLDYLKQSRSEKIYEELASQVAETTAETEPESQEPEYVSPVDFEELWAINEDVVGWLTIPGTVIDYPILHDPESNDTYLYTDIEGNDSAAGSIYLDCDNEADFSDLHNVIYGHHMKNGTMFKDIMKFRDQEFLEEHQEAVIYLPDREILVKPFACLYTTPDGIRRMTKFVDEEELQAYTEEMTRGSEAYVEPDREVGRLFSFITCSYEFDDARTILYAYEVTDEEMEDRDQAASAEEEEEPEEASAEAGQ